MEFFYQKPKTTIYDWSKIPKEYSLAVINEDGTVHLCNCAFLPVLNDIGLWELQYKKESEPVITYWEKCLDKSIVLNPPNNWRESLERRPE